MFELKVLKLMAAAHRGTVNLALRTITVRDKLSTKKYSRSFTLAADMEVMAYHAVNKAQRIRAEARDRRRETTLKLNAAQNIILNAKDELDNFTNNA